MNPKYIQIGALSIQSLAMVWTLRNARAVSGRATIAEILSALKAGRSSGVKVVSSEAELVALYERLSAGGKPATPPTYKGTMVELPDGTKVGLRLSSTSGGKAIDVSMPDGTRRKVHIE